MSADWTISRVAGIEPGARSIQRLERSRPCLRRTRRIMGIEWGSEALQVDGEIGGMAVCGRESVCYPSIQDPLGMV